MIVSMGRVRTLHEWALASETSAHPLIPSIMSNF